MTSVMQVYPSCQSQVRLLWPDKSSVKILSKYLDYTEVFMFDLIMELPENNGMNKYIIKLIEYKQVLYEPIYSLKLVEM